MDKKAVVIESNGNDVTNFFVNGVNEVLKIAQTFGIKEAILTQRSPSCGSGHIYDGTFSKTLINGDGVTTALLKRNGIKVISKEELQIFS